MHAAISPAILYWGTPAVLITTENEDGTSNIGPMSSAWWLGHRCVIGFGSFSQTTQNLLRGKKCVLNIPFEDLIDAVNLLAKTTGSNPVPEWKQQTGYAHVKDKFAHAGLTPQDSELVKPVQRIKECPVQVEAELVVATEMMGDEPALKGVIMNCELKIVRVYVESWLRLEGHRNRVNPAMVRPIFVVFGEFYGMQGEKLKGSRLAEVAEECYRRLTGGDAQQQPEAMVDWDQKEEECESTVAL